MENLNLHCRMYRSCYPQIGMPVMIQVNNIDEQGADVSLLEYNGKNGRINEHEDFVLDRIELAVVISVDGGSILLSKRSNTVASIHDCEANYYKARYVQRIMHEVAITIGLRLKDVCIATNWPSYEELMLYLEDRRGNYWKNLPSDLKRELRRKLKMMTVTSWRLMHPGLLNLGSIIIPGNIQLCWAFALVRQMEAKLKRNGTIAMDVHLSVQDLVNKTSREYLNRTGDIDLLANAVWVLSAWGIVEERHCPLTFSLDVRGETTSPDIPVFKIRNMKVYKDTDFDFPEGWDKVLEEAVLDGPVAATVLWFKSYRDNLGGEKVYKPTDAEWAVYEADTRARHLYGLVMLLTGFVTDNNGIKLWEFQDSRRDVGNGDRGFLRFARYPSLIVEYVELEL